MLSLAPLEESVESLSKSGVKTVFPPVPAEHEEKLLRARRGKEGSLPWPWFRGKRCFSSPFFLLPLLCVRHIFRRNKCRRGEIFFFFTLKRYFFKDTLYPG